MKTLSLIVASALVGLALTTPTPDEHGSFHRTLAGYDDPPPVECIFCGGKVATHKKRIGWLVKLQVNNGLRMLMVK